MPRHSEINRFDGVGVEDGTGSKFLYLMIQNSINLAEYTILLPMHIQFVGGSCEFCYESRYILAQPTVHEDLSILLDVLLTQRATTKPRLFAAGHQTPFVGHEYALLCQIPNYIIWKKPSVYGRALLC